MTAPIMAAPMPTPLTPGIPEPNSTAEPEPGRRSPATAMLYHRAVRDHFRDRSPELWQWFAARDTPDALRDHVRLELLKRAVRFERADRAELYRVADEVAVGLGLRESLEDAATVPITLYQAQSGEGMNAGLYFAPGEIHVVLQGPVLQRLGGEELRALLAHEFTHYEFLVAEGGEFRNALAVLDSLTQGDNAEFAQLTTARIFALYVETLCDRGALHVCENPLAVIAMLVKVETGLEAVDPESYVRQAEEIFAGGIVQAEGGSHPEMFIRARALTLFAERGADAEAEIAAMIEGPARLDALDLPGQTLISERTRCLIGAFLADERLQTDAHLAQAHLYFDDYQPAAAVELSRGLIEAMRCEDTSLRDYYCYVLIDFVAVDRDVLDPALVRALGMMSWIGWDDRLAELAAKELGLRKNEMAKLRREASQIGDEGGGAA